MWPWLFASSAIAVAYVHTSLWCCVLGHFPRQTPLRVSTGKHIILVVICAREGGIQLVPKIAAGARGGGPFQMWSSQREIRSESETSVRFLAAGSCKVQSWERSAFVLIGRFLGESTESVPSGTVGWFVRSGFVPRPVLCLGFVGFGSYRSITKCCQ